MPVCAVTVWIKSRPPRGEHCSTGCQFLAAGTLSSLLSCAAWRVRVRGQGGTACTRCAGDPALRPAAGGRSALEAALLTLRVCLARQVLLTSIS